MLFVLLLLALSWAAEANVIDKTFVCGNAVVGAKVGGIQLDGPFVRHVLYAPQLAHFKPTT